MHNEHFQAGAKYRSVSTNRVRTGSLGDWKRMASDRSRWTTIPPWEVPRDYQI